MLHVQLVDLHQRRIYPASITVENGHIARIQAAETAPNLPFCLPGFIDAHIHIESSMLIPSEFARMAVLHGTVGTVSDPHEIANVLGIEGVRFMLENGQKVPFKFFFGAPSCVPATAFETAGAVIGPDGVRELLEMPDIWYLAEMMNWPGVIYQDPEVMEKIRIAQQIGKPIDGHAPGLKGDLARQYAQAGMTTDHECFTLEEALDKIAAGMKIIIREGSAARNFEALIPLMGTHPERLFFCSDDKHPDELMLGHINLLVARALAKGFDLFDVLRAACFNPVQHYGLPVGLLREGDPADFILVDNLQDFKVLQTWIHGEKVAENGQSFIRSVPAKPINQFVKSLKKAADFAVPYPGNTAPTLNVIEVIDRELITQRARIVGKLEGGQLVADPRRDLLKIAVVNRYADAPPAVAFVKNIGLQRGAIASSVGHDSHNIIAVGADDASLARAVNLLMEAGGGISAVDGELEKVLPLPFAGLMAGEDGYTVGKAYSALDQAAKQMGATLTAPYMSLSFLALLVIPALKLSDKGLFDGEKFEFLGLID